MNVELKVQENLSRLFKQKPEQTHKQFIDIFELLAMKMIEPTQDEMPQDRGDLKQLNNFTIRRTKYGAEMVVLNKYAKFLYQGTIRNKGKPDAGYTTGNSYKSRYFGFLDEGMGIVEARDNMVKLIKILTKRGKFAGIKPNKFTDRALKKNEKMLVSTLNQEIKKML